MRGTARAGWMLAAALTCFGILGRSSAAAPHRDPASRHELPRQAEKPPALFGYIRPWEKAATSLSLAGGWNATRGWMRPPEPPIIKEWNTTSWQLFPDPAADAQTLTTQPLPEWSEYGYDYRLTALASGGVAVSGVAAPRPRRARRQHPDRPELRAATRRLLARHGIRPPARPRILEAYRVDLNGDGLEEVLWTARSREGWQSPYTGWPRGPRPGDYALLGLRYLTRQGVRSAALALAAASDDSITYRLFSPLDVDGDGRMEILAHQQGFEEDSLLVFTFNGQQLAGVLGTSVPSHSGRRAAAQK